MFWCVSQIVPSHQDGAGSVEPSEASDMDMAVIAFGAGVVAWDLAMSACAACWLAGMTRPIVVGAFGDVAEIASFVPKPATGWLCSWLSWTR